MAHSWFVEAKEKKIVDSYSYSEFTNIKPNGEGRFSKVNSADWPVSNRKVALKRLKLFNDETFAVEVQLHCLSHASKNVIRFLGLTEDNGSCLMVLEYADMNSLRAFLRKGKDLSWNSKYNLSLDIAKGLQFLHHRGVIHRDLHTNNIVVSQLHLCKQPEYVAKITDFGGAIEVNNENDINGIIGQISFTDPRYLNEPRKFRKDYKSDVYSMGVIFWEIATERTPFEDYMPESRGDFRNLCLTLAIISGVREKDEEKTPDDYKKLYRNCWSQVPGERPRVTAAIETLKSIISGSPQQTITAGQ